MRTRKLNLLFILLISQFANCKQPAAQPAAPLVVSSQDSTALTTRWQLIAAKPDTVFFTDTLYLPGAPGNKKQVDSLKTALFNVNYKLEKVKFYISICERNPTQKQFFFGWIRRAVSE